MPARKRSRDVRPFPAPPTTPCQPILALRGRGGNSSNVKPRPIRVAFTWSLSQKDRMDDEAELRAKLRKIEALFARPGTAGERQAAETALGRILQRLKQAQQADRLIEMKFTF